MCAETSLVILFVLVAQRIERPVAVRKVAGSIPAEDAIIFHQTKELFTLFPETLSRLILLLAI